MTTIARVTVTLKPDILDPAGEAVRQSLSRQGLLNSANVRIGKVIDVTLNERKDLDEQLAGLKKASRELLSNPIMEDVHIECLGEKNVQRN